MITTAIQTEIAFICNMLSKLFESTRNLSDQALNDIIDALMQLSIECSDLAYIRNEPCLFALAKLYETSISNLNRINLFWQKVTVHLLISCKHTNIKYREWSVDSICNMIRSTFNFKYSNTNTIITINDQENQILRDSILNPLFELSSIGFNDVRQKQIECTLAILRHMGQFLNESWPLCLNIIGAIQKEHNESLIRSALISALRPAVRKSAGQTLFFTISSHGSLFSSVDLHWKDLVWKVLFPLLEQVKHFTSTASKEKDKHLNQPNFLMDHSRVTAEKQWSETSVLT